MARSDEVFRPALQGKKIPIISLDNKWYRLMAGIDHTPHMQELEEQLKNLLKRQGKINTDLKTINKEKAKLRDEIVNAMDEEGGKQKQEEYSAKINALNEQMDAYQDELLDLPKQIDQVNVELMLETMEICYDVIAQNTEKINEIADWIADMRIELKKNVVRKQECELKNQQMYSYMHDIFGPDVIDLFDMKYNPEVEHVVKTTPSASPAKAAKDEKPEDEAKTETQEAGSGTADGQE
ncbi:MAG: hypothetical protein IKQ27_15480 [Lachnospiraceae bacterium]|nr:hypothetical protein [Lachnospiraceae bacterium]